jgi:starch synthase
MYTVMVTPECAPVAKAGGLGDVVFGLSRELEIRGHAVEIVLPKYDAMRYHDIWDLHVTFPELWVPWHGGAVHCSVWFGFVHGRKCYFIEPHSADNFFGRGALYGSPDDVERFSFFSKAALEFLLQSGKRPDIIHCHDWQTALVPVLLYEQYQHLGLHRQRVCFTVHNFRHQGLASEGTLWAARLDDHPRFFDRERLGDDFDSGTLNLMKGGVVYSNFVTSVSPHHAVEAQFTDQGFGLGPTLQRYQDKFGGVLNGVDYEQWNPEIDPYIPQRYSVHDLDAKYRNKEALRDRFWLRQDYKPVVAFVGRLDEQKGMHLVHHALFYALEHGAQFVLLGNPVHDAIGEHFWHLKRHLNDNPDCHLEISYTEELAHLVFAGSDLVVMPSLFEPCGLVPMIALRYGTVPVVHAVGGMVDTIEDRDHSWAPLHERNGYVFHHNDHAAVESALQRALGLWFGYPHEFRDLMVNGMRQDYSWARAGQDYINIYEYIRDS